MRLRFHGALALMITTAMQLLATEIPTVDAIKLEQNEKSLQTLNLLTLA